MKLILQAIKSLFRKMENHITQNVSAISAISKKAEKAQNTADAAQNTADAAWTALKGKANKESPVFTGSFSMNRQAGTTIGVWSHTEGYNTTASGYCSHAEGQKTTASGYCSHAEGEGTTASDYRSHAEGVDTTASGVNSHAEGLSTTASGPYQHVQGKFNISDTTSAHIVGNGTDASALSNAHTLDWNGVPWYQGRPQFGGNAQDDGSQTVMANGDKELILTSSTADSTKKFKITVDDSGTLTATEVT